MTLLAAIDLGTHSALLLIARWQPPYLLPWVDAAQTTHLGAGLANTGEIGSAALERLWTVLDDYQQQLQAVGCDLPLVFGTAVFRQARNRTACIQRLQARYGWTLRVLSPAEEAHYAFGGAVQGLAQPFAWVVDIGGGSTEVIVGRGQIDQSWSLPVGAVVLRDQFALQDQLSSQELQRLDAALGETFLPISPSQESIPVRVTGGTATTLAALKLRLTGYDVNAIEGTPFTLTDLDALFEQLNGLDLQARSRLPGMEAGRAGVILPALRLLRSLLMRLEANSFTVTVRGPRYGLLAEAATH